ncbi:MAG: MarC family protein [Luteibacter sp.]
MNATLAFLQTAVTTVVEPPAQVLSLAQVFTLLFVVMGPPLKTPLAYYARMQSFDSATRHTLAWKTAILATIAVLIGGFLGLALQRSWQISLPAMLLAGGVIFFLVSLRTVLEQYSPSPVPHPVPEGTVPTRPTPPGAFDLAVPMIVTPYGLAGLITLLASSHTTERTLWIVVLLIAVMVLHLLAMLFCGPIVRGIGPLPFKLFGTVIGSLTVGLSIQMMILGYQSLAPLISAPIPSP